MSVATKHRNLGRVLLFALLLLVAPLTDTSAQTETATEESEPICVAPTVRTDVRPDPYGVPTIVRTGVRAVDIREINDVDQTITIDIAIRRIWTDHRLADLAGCRMKTDEIWFPELILTNSGRLFERWPDRITIGPGGEATYLQRISGTIASYHSLHDFPFDRQAISIHLMPLDQPPSKMKLELDEEFTGLGQYFNISDWIIEDYDASAVDAPLLAFGEERAGIVFTVKANRVRSFWLWKVILPLSLIVFMSWCVFWIDPVRYGSQIGLSATSMLTIIAFIFATTNMLPALGYFTRLDAFIAGATVLVFLSLMISLTTSYLVSVEQRESATRLDRICRTLFPVVFFAFAALVFLPVL